MIDQEFTPNLAAPPALAPLSAPAGLLHPLQIPSTIDAGVQIAPSQQTQVATPFLEVEFPRTISYKAVGGPTWSTVVNQGLSGNESRNQNWSRSRGKWKVSLITPTAFQRQQQQFIDLLIGFFENVAGKASGFRLYDHLDHQATAQALVATANGVQLAITRSIGGRSYVQLISKPICPAPAGSASPSPVDYQGHALQNTVFLHNTQTPVLVDPTTGIVQDGTPAGTLVDFQFDYPVRFDTDELPLTAEASAIGAGRPVVSANSVQLIEVLPPNF